MRRIAKNNFGIFSSLKSMGQSVKNVGRLVFQPGTEINETMSHTNFRFDEESSEWQSLITQNSYEEMIFLNQDMPQLQNFGTVDNPHLIYTSEVPFRFVACTGPPSEDDFEYHEVMWMLLRDGPLQRCSGCGQVFKLVRLRDEFSIDNDYYQTGLTEQTVEELGEADVWGTNSLFRPFMFFTGDHTQMETNSNYIYTLMRMDDHDRYLTDPAFRLEHNQIVEETNRQMVDTLQKIDQSFLENFEEKIITNISREQYENVIETEKSIEMLNRHFERIQRFTMRSMLDPQNHSRREERMDIRKKVRRENPTFYLGDIDEDFLQFQDYFETDCELDPVNPQKDLKDAEKISLNQIENNLKNADFDEAYTGAKEKDATGLIDREMFRYKFREASDSKEDFKRKEERRLIKREEWMNSGVLEKAINIYTSTEKASKNKDISLVERNNLIEASKLAYKKIVDLEIELALVNYETYFESDEEDFVTGISLGKKAEQIGNLSNVEKLRLLEISDLDLDQLKSGIALTLSRENVNAQKDGFVAYLLETFTIAENIERNTSILGGKDRFNLTSEIDYKNYVNDLKKETQVLDEGEQEIEKLKKKRNID